MGRYGPANDHSFESGVGAWKHLEQAGQACFYDKKAYVSPKVSDKAAYCIFAIDHEIDAELQGILINTQPLLIVGILFSCGV